MKYNLNLFGYTIESQLTFEHDVLQVGIDRESQASLKAYLLRVLVRYGRDPKPSDSLETLIQQAIEIEKGMSGHLSEPKIKLPYEFQPEIKEQLIEAAELQDISATQLLIRLIEKKYQNVCGGEA